MAVNSFKDLLVWRKAMDLIPLVYEVAGQLPDYEKYALADQLRRSVVSIPSNIAEGSKRGSRADFRQFCKIASGSSAELETQLLAVRVLYPAIAVASVLTILLEVQKMLTALNQRLSKPLQTIN